MPERSTGTGAYARNGLSGSRAEDNAELIQALDAHAGLVIASAARVLGNLADAEDVAQDVAEKLLKSNLPRVRSWPAYLRTLAVKEALDQLRRRRDWVHLETQDPDGGPEAAAYDEQRADILRRAISKLSQRDGWRFGFDSTHLVR